MRHLYLFVAILCLSTACQKTHLTTSSDETKSGKILDEERKNWIEKTLKFFQQIDEDKIKSGEESYVGMLSFIVKHPLQKKI